MIDNSRPPCQACSGHRWEVHSWPTPTSPSDADPGEGGRCRVSGCRCPGYASKPKPIAEFEGRGPTLERVGDEVEAGAIVIVLPVAPEELHFAQLSVVRAILGGSLPGDWPVKLVTIRRDVTRTIDPRDGGHNDR